MRKIHVQSTTCLPETHECDELDHSRTAVPVRGLTRQIISNLSPKRDWGPKYRVNQAYLVLFYQIRQRKRKEMKARKTSIRGFVASRIDLLRCCPHYYSMNGAQTAINWRARGKLLWHPTPVPEDSSFGQTRHFLVRKRASIYCNRKY